MFLLYFQKETKRKRAKQNEWYYVRYDVCGGWENTQYKEKSEIVDKF